MGKKILIIGSLNMDLSVRVQNMPLVGETILGKSVSYEVGGKGANQACAVGKLNGDVKMLGCVGTDSFGGKLCHSLEASNVDTSHIKEAENSTTGMAVIYVDAKGDNSIVVIPGANDQCLPDYIREMDELIVWCDYIVMQMEIPYETVLYAAKRGKELGKVIILNPAPVPEYMPEELLKLTDYITPNETELKKLAELHEDMDLEDMVRKGAAKLIEKGGHNVIVTLGEKGAFWFNRENEKFFPARKVKAVDTTAAGDCFNGAFAVGLAEEMPVEDAIRFANLAASIAVTKKGAQSSLPDREQLKNI